MSGASFDAEDGGLDEASWRALVVASAIAATAICLGGVVAIAALERGASTAISLILMTAIVASGAVAALGVFRHRKRSRGRRTPPVTLLEQQLSARYGAQVRRVAWHVWRINGELIEATLDPQSGHLLSGGRELHL
jgi:ABC-type Fe3+ transport system permease subunit